MYLTLELVEELQARPSRIEGHVRGINRMLDARRDCDDILIQIAGVKAAVNQVAIRLLEGHLDSCVAESLRAGNGTDAVTRFKESLAQVLK
ncbi:MAG: metal-sensitive transcriptional regulator [Chloroflexi bacterium]|nr:metal-sensitive transcriptional regulator [Chloroflexota bacterium]